MLKKISSYKITIVEYVVGKRNVQQAIYHVFVCCVEEQSDSTPNTYTKEKKKG